MLFSWIAMDPKATLISVFHYAYPIYSLSSVHTCYTIIIYKTGSGQVHRTSDWLLEQKNWGIEISFVVDHWWKLNMQAFGQKWNFGYSQFKKINDKFSESNEIYFNSNQHKHYKCIEKLLVTLFLYVISWSLIYIWIILL